MPVSAAPIRPLLLALLTCVGLSGVSAVLATAAPAPARDTLIPASVPYKGYRLHIRDATLLKQKRNRYLVSVRVVNTGSQPVGLGPGFPVHFLQTAFDDALGQSGLLPLAPGLRQALIDGAVTLAPGASLEGLEVWVSPSAPEATPVARTDDFERTYRKRLPSGTNTPTSEREEERLYASAKPVTTPSPGAAPANEACVDLEVAAIKVLRRDKRSALVEMSIVNSGAAALTRELLGTGTALDIYLGGSEAVTAASERLARVNLSTRLGSSLGDGLAPGRSVAITERLDLGSLTRYTRVLIAQLDPGQVVAECDETNNETSALLER